VKVGQCSRRQIVQPCTLEGFAYQIDPYIGCEHHCHYCYALNRAETDWSEEILIHQDISSRLYQEISTLQPQTVYIGWNSDPYQPSEETYQQTHIALDLLARRGFPVCVLTKSDLIIRDVDMLARMTGSSVGVSIAFQDEEVRRLFETRAPSNERRIEALKRLKNAGLETYALICPVMPFLTDAESLIEAVAPYADTIWIYALSMRNEVDRNWQNVKDILDHHFPELTRRYRRIAFSPDDQYWSGFRRRLEGMQVDTRLKLKIML